MKFFIIFLSTVFSVGIVFAKEAKKISISSSTTTRAGLPSDSIYNLDSSWLNQKGETVSLSQFRGKPVVLSMVYLKCKFSCPLTIVQMKEVEKLLSQQNKKNVQFVLFSFDHIHDTPKTTLEYAEKNKLSYPQWTFLTTTKEIAVRELSTLIDFKFKKLDNGEFEHSYAIIALDSEGRIVGRTEGSEMNPKIISDLLNKK
ncbi:MAG: SCO family protein [Pseudobdellovibrionaceae bacterium]